MNNHSNNNSKIVLTCAWHSSKYLTSLHSCSNSIRCRLILYSCVDEVFKAGKGSETCLASHNLQVIGSEFSHRAFFAPHRGLSSICSWNFLAQVHGGLVPFPALSISQWTAFSPALGNREASVCGGLTARLNEQHL